jgi:hypothetical protein
MDDEQLISIDWKSVGNDYLEFFPDTYPDLAFLQGDAWEALCDELATEMPESVFDPLSGLLARHGYELWNANDGSDMYHLAIVRAGEDPDFKARLLTIDDDEGEPVDIEPERLGLEGARAALNAPRKKSRKKAQFDPIAETDYHNTYGGLGIGRNTHRLVEYEENGQSYRGIADLTVFPFEIEDAQPVYTLLDQKHSFYALYTNGPIQYWTWQNPPQKGRKVPAVQQIIAIDDFASGQWRVVDGTAVGPDTFIYGEGCEDTLFALLPILDAQGAIVQGRQSLCRIRDAVCTPVADLACDIAALVPINRDEVLVSFSGDKSYLLLIDTANGQQRRLSAGGEDMDTPFVINDDEIGFITLASRAHAELDYINEHTAYLNRLNIRNGNLQRAELTGLHNEFSHNPTVLRDQPLKKIKVRSFEGFIKAGRGHEGWVVLTYLTTYSGKYDRAWLWNTATEDVVKITAKECPRLEPFLFHYLPARNRYVADSSCRLDLLKPFDELQANCPSGKLIWEAVVLP